MRPAASVIPAVAALAAALIVPGATAQPPQTFEVASIKPSAALTVTETRRYPGGRFVASGVTLKDLIQRAYDVKDFQISGGPKWLHSERYDIAAKAGENIPRAQSLDPMIQALLADRFKLKIHRETREMPIYSLVVDRGGPKLQPNTTAPGPAWTKARGLLKGDRISMAMFASDLLEAALNRVVTDNTNIPGNFDVRLTWTPEEEQAAGPAGESLPAPATDIAVTSIFAALREQLGLRLEPRRGVVEVIVVDSAERPSEN